MNFVRTAFLMGLLISLFLLGGYLLGGRQGMIIGFGIAVVMNFGAYFFSDKLVLAQYHAQETTPHTHPRLHAMVEDLSVRGNIPKPRVYVIPTEAPNAFATGRNPKHSAVAVTDGLLRLMNEDEVKGVIAHELGHVVNRDILISTIAATVAGAIAMIANMARWSMFFGGGHRGRDRDGGGNPLGLILMLVSLILLPFAAMLIQMAISRSREFGADATGARLAGNPYGLMSALRKLGMARAQLQASPQTAHLFIVKPFLEGRFMNLFSTHPPLEKRIEKLQEMAQSGHFAA